MDRMEALLAQALLREEARIASDPSYARLYQEMCSILDACDNIKEKRISKTKVQKKGIHLADPQDVNRAVDIVMTDIEEKNLDNPLPHYI